jgi:3-oxoacyl-[acyl-carrier protein] reductase
MNDVLLALGARPQARALIKTIGLPVPLPVPLRRATGPWEAEPLRGKCVSIAGGALCEQLRRIVEQAGASSNSTERVDAAVLDATSLTAPEQLRELFEFFQPRAAQIAASGRVVLIGRPVAEAASAQHAATQQALEGFVRSLSKEVGKRGTTAVLVRAASGSEPGLAPLLRFLLSPRSAFITGQVVALEATPAADWPVLRPLAGKVALVTGAGRGIGHATARSLAAEGAHVVCLERPVDGELAAQLASEIGGSILLCDVREGGTPDSIARELRARHGGVDIVVHNAGVTRDKTLQRMSVQQWEQVIDVNLRAVLHIDQALEGLLRDGGREICLASIAGIAGTMGQTNYAAAKAGLIGYVRKRAELLRSRRITVNAVAPGLIETRLTAAMPVFIREAGRRLSALGQGGEPRDVAEAITFLASPGADGLTGGVLRVCGGAFLGA